MLAVCEASSSSSPTMAGSRHDPTAVDVLGAGCAATLHSGASIVDNIINHEEIAPIHAHTTSVNRSYSDLHQGEFLFYAFSLCALRTALQQPINLALARKQTSADANRLRTGRLLINIFRQEGRWRALAAGMPALTIGCALSEAVYLGLFECCREQLPIDSDASRDAASGYLADVVCRVIHIPLSVIAFRQMTFVSKDGLSRRRGWWSSRAWPTHRSGSKAHPTRSHASCASPFSASSRRPVSPYEAYQHPRYEHPKSRLITAGRCTRPSMWSTLTTMYGERGLRSVFAGFGTTLLVGCQWTAAWWALYGQVKAQLYRTAEPALRPAAADSSTHRSAPRWARALRTSPYLPDWCLAADDNIVLNTTASFVTSASTAVLFNPYLVVRTNLQVTPNSTLWSATRDVFRSRGLAGFYSGLTLSINACILEGALASWSYEYAKLWSDKTRGHDEQ